jgi:hypothetical protein
MKLGCKLCCRGESEAVTAVLAQALPSQPLPKKPIAVGASRFDVLVGGWQRLLIGCNVLFSQPSQLNADAGYLIREAAFLCFSIVLPFSKDSP